MASPRSPWRISRSPGTAKRGCSSAVTLSSCAGSSPWNSAKSCTSSRVARPRSRRGRRSAAAAPAAHLAPQVVVELLPDQAFGVQGLILGRLQPQRRLAQEAALQRVGIGRVLQAQRIERADCRGEPLADDLVEQTAHPLAEHERHVAADEARQLLLHHAADQEELEARREARHQRAVDARMAVQEMGEPEARAERQLAARRPDVAEAAVGAGAVDDVLDVGQQALEDRGATPGDGGSARGAARAPGSRARTGRA